MGWKNVKDHYQIKHIVQVTSAGICIGSAYMHDIIIVGLDGEIKKRYGAGGFRGNNDLERYQAALDADPDTLRYLIEKPDSFAASLPVFTYDGALIIEEACEAYGWPNVTHAGHIQYANRFSPDRDQVIDWAKANARSGIGWLNERVADAEAKLSEARMALAEQMTNLDNLLEAYPEASDEPA